LPNFRDEPEEIINKILNEIKSEVENMATNFGKDKINYILLLLLLNERLNVIKTKDEIKYDLYEIGLWSGLKLNINNNKLNTFFYFILLYMNI